MLTAQPLLLRPAGKDYLWGGTRLKKEYYKDHLPLTPLAETWECSVHPDGPSTVANGPLAGITLDELFREHPEFTGSRSPGQFPLLIKLIDAEENLSVQVHPDDAFAQKWEGQSGKTEMWYILDARPGAELVHGFSHTVTAEQLKRAIRDGDLSKHLQRVPVHAGDVFYIPPGTVHAIGGGVLLAEIQQNSNVTYRLYDYDRTDKDGNRRPLHFDKAVQVLCMESEKKVRQIPRLVMYNPGCAREILCRCAFFEVERLQISLGLSFSVGEESCQVLLCIDGRGGIETDGMRRPLRFIKGDCILIPAGTGRCHILGKSSLLKVRF